MITSVRPLVLFLVLLASQDIKETEGSNDLCVYLVNDDGDAVSGQGDDQDVLPCCSSRSCVFNSLSDALRAATSNLLINLTTNMNLTLNVTIDHVDDITINGVNSPTVHCTNTGGVHFISCSNVTITGIIWEGCGYNDAGTSYISPAMEFYNSSNITIEGCSFYNSIGQGVVLSMASDVWITSCQFSHNNQYDSHGAAIHCTYDIENHTRLSLVVNNCSFVLNGPAESVLFINGSTSEVYKIVSVQNSVFLNNQGVAINTSHIHLHLGGDVLFQHNTASNGGAISSTSSIIEVDSNSVVYFNHNSAITNGGAVYLYNSSINFGINSSVEFEGNTANENGGSIYCESGSQISFGKYSTATFTSNDAYMYGGAMYLQYSDVSTINSAIKFVNSSATQYGGAVYLNHSDISINNNSSVQFNNNSAQYGGGAYLYYSDISADNSTITFTKNTAATLSQYTYGGAVYLHYSDISAYSSVIKFTRNNATASQDSGYAYGGAVYLLNSDISANNSVITFTKNNATLSRYTYGGAVCLDYSDISYTKTN